MECLMVGLHYEHCNLFSKCRAMAGTNGVVYVAIDSDNKVKKDKGSNRPIFSENERKKYIEKLKYPINHMLYPTIDKVFIFNTNEDLYELIKNLNPDFIVKAKNWYGNVVGSDLAEVEYVELNTEISTSEVERRIKER